MGALYDSIGNKDPGHLIKSDDWNDLVEAVEKVDQRLTDEVAQLASDISGLDGRLTAAEGEIAQVRQEVDAYFAQHYRLTMNTQRTRYAIGELAEIRAVVTDVWGNPLPAVPAAQRPWVDFLTVWGQLKPGDGFVSRGGAGNRTLSVRTNENGEARVLLRAENAEGFTDEEEDEVSGSLQTHHAATGLSLAETFINVNTPMEAKNNGAFAVMAQEYDRADSNGVRKYLDAHYLRNQYTFVPILPPIFTHRWKDYRTTVMAVATRDNDPTTPDHGRGVSSIHITFRDWISPWFALQYLTIDDGLVGNYIDRFRPKVSDDYAGTMTGVLTEIDDILVNQGILGKIKYLKNINVALDRMEVTGPPVFYNDLVRQVQTGIAMQQTLQGVQMASGFGEQQVAMQALGDAYIASAAGEAATSGKVNQLEAQVSGMQSDVSDVKRRTADLETSVAVVDQKADSVQQTGVELAGRVETVQSQVRNVEYFNVSDLNNQMNKLNQLWLQFGDAGPTG
jgi:predicted  nucleic acid-binding Zn-ribbon protein